MPDSEPKQEDYSGTVLIVDDDPLVRKTLESLLLTQNYKLASVDNGHEALRLAAELTPDVILLDIMMPDMDGIEVCRRLRADPILAEVPVIMVTALDDREARLQALEVGADDFVSKPFDRVELRARVHTIIRLNRYRQLLMERMKRQEAEEQIRRREQELRLLKELKQLQDRFISNASHELRTPLSTIMLLSGNLDNFYHQLDDKKRQKMIKDVRKHARTLNSLIDNVLTVSHIDHGSVSLERQLVDLAQVTREEISQQLPLSQEKKQQVRLAGIDRLPVWGNQNQIQQMIRNLLNNAIKYTPPEGHITCECLLTDGADTPELIWPDNNPPPDGRWAVLRVVDTGLGISPEHLPHLFERFYRGQPQGNVPGTGLGLSIVSELVRLHDARIAVSSNPEQGTVFAIYFPQAEYASS